MAFFTPHLDPAYFISKNCTFFTIKIILKKAKNNFDWKQYLVTKKEKKEQNPDQGKEDF
jgi:hypothetical protein